jgi:acetyl esterase/lipase
MASKELERLIEFLRSQPQLEPDLSPDELRAGFEAIASMFPVPPDVSLQPVDVGGMPGEWIAAPGASDDRVVFYLHGGGYVIGSLATHRAMVARISQAASARALVIEYRLAPEDPFPAAVEDAIVAYRWLLAQGVDPARVVVVGDSAGGGLTVAALVSLRDAGDAMPAAAVCLSPWTDLEGTGESMTTKAAIDPLIERDGIEIMAKIYLAGADPRTPLASPIYADLHGLPPLLIHVGTAELLLDDAVRLADRARAAGVEVVLEPWEDMIHVWHCFAQLLPEAQKAIDRVGEFIREHTSS